MRQSEVFEVVAGDTSPSIGYQLPTQVNITAATAIFRMRRRANAEIVVNDGPVRIVSTTPPVVAYDWDPADTTIPGYYVGQFEVTYADSAVETFPFDGIPITIGEAV